MRIFLAESDPELRVGLQFLINQQPGFQVIGIADNGNEFSSKLKASQPDVLLLDWYLPGKPMNDLIADIRSLDLQLKIVCISIHPEDESEAWAAGVDHFFSKEAPPDNLIVLLNTMKTQKTNGEPVLSKGE